MIEPGLWPLIPGDRDGPVEGDDGRRGQCEQFVVEQAHLARVGLPEDGASSCNAAMAAWTDQLLGGWWRRAWVVSLAPSSIIDLNLSRG